MMSCYICGRGSCCPSFHSLEEQGKYDEVEESYNHYLDTRERVQQEISEEEEEEESSDED